MRSALTGLLDLLLVVTIVVASGSVTFGDGTATALAASLLGH